MREVEALIALVEDRGFPVLMALVVFSTVRALAMLYFFVVLNLGFGQALMLRLLIGLIIGFPMLIQNLDLVDLFFEQDSFPVVVLVLAVASEFLIGATIGLMYSLPFFALKYAGTITDQTRGETDSGIQTPMDGQITTFGLLYLVIGILAFASADGFQHLAQSYYTSFTYWPLGAVIPTIGQEGLMSFANTLLDCIKLAVRIAAPLLAVLILVEITSGIASRLGQRLNFYNLAFSIKNLSAIVLLPVLMIYVWALANDNIIRSFAPEFKLEAFFR